MTSKPTYEELEKRIQELERAVSERERIEEELRESQNRFQLLYERAPLGYQSLDEDGNFIEVNPTWLDILGYSREEVIGKSFSEFLHPDWRDHFKENFPRFRAIGEVLGVEFEMVKKDGLTILVSFNGKIGKDKYGNFQQTHCIFQDITEHKRVEEEAQRRADQLELIFEVAQRVSGELKLKALLSETVTTVRDTFDYHNVMLELVNKEAKCMDIQSVAGAYADFFPDKHMAIGEGMTGTAAATGETQISGDVSKDPHYVLDVEETKSELAVPIKSGKNVVGVLDIQSDKFDAFDETEVLLMEVLADQLAVAIENARLYDAVQQELYERKEAERALRVSEDRYRAVSELTSDYSYAYKVESDGELINEWGTGALARITGYTTEEVHARGGWESLIYSDDMSISIEKFKALFEGRSMVVQYRILSKSGDVRWIRDYAKPVWNDTENRLERIYGAVKDITETKHVEELIRESEEKYRSAMEANPDPVVVYNIEEKVIYFNPAFSKVFGWTMEECMGKKMAQFVPPEYLAESKLMIKKALSGESYSSFETRRYTKDRRNIPVSVSRAIFRDEDGNPFGSVVNIRDISSQKKLESQLQQAQKMEAIGTLAGGIAHDFNNILSPIMVHTELATMDLPPNNPVQHNLKEIFKAGERATDMVKQILAFNRKGEGKRVTIKMTPIIKDVLKLIRSSIPTTIDIQQSFEAESDIVFADPTQIHQILLNLCTNASHSMQERGGELTINLTEEHLDPEVINKFSDLNPGPYLKLTVSDTGHGIGPETMERIFEPYFTTKETGEGTGMGLAMVHGIVKSYEGDITVESEQGKGTTFTVYLPMIEANVSLVEESSVHLPKGIERILFIDDEKAAVDVIQAMMEKLGYKVTSRTSSIEALEAFRNNPEGFDLVITDMTMPNMTGKDLAKEMMTIRPDIPIILCTGFSEQIDDRRAVEMGISAFVMKPIVMRQIANTIRRVLDKK